MVPQNLQELLWLVFHQLARWSDWLRLACDGHMLHLITCQLYFFKCLSFSIFLGKLFRRSYCSLKCLEVNDFAILAELLLKVDNQPFWLCPEVNQYIMISHWGDGASVARGSFYGLLCFLKLLQKAVKLKLVCLVWELCCWALCLVAPLELRVSIGTLK